MLLHKKSAFGIKWKKQIKTFSGFFFDFEFRLQVFLWKFKPSHFSSEFIKSLFIYYDSELLASLLLSIVLCVRIKTENNKIFMHKKSIAKAWVINQSDNKFRDRERIRSKAHTKWTAAADVETHKKKTSSKLNSELIEYVMQTRNQQMDTRDSETQKCIQACFYCQILSQLRSVSLSKGL